MARKTFWTTLPGIITAIASLVTAIGGLLFILYQLNVIGPNRVDPTKLIVPKLLSPENGAILDYYQSAPKTIGHCS